MRSFPGTGLWALRISDQNNAPQKGLVPAEEEDLRDLMFSTLGRALPIEIRVKVNARRPRLKAARAPFESDKRTIKLCLNLASGAFDFKYNYVWYWPKCCPTLE